MQCRKVKSKDFSKYWESTFCWSRRLELPSVLCVDDGLRLPIVCCSNHRGVGATARQSSYDRVGSPTVGSRWRGFDTQPRSRSVPKPPQHYLGKRFTRVDATRRDHDGFCLSTRAPKIGKPPFYDVLFYQGWRVRMVSVCLTSRFDAS